MVRKYVRKRGQKYGQGDVDQAIREIKGGRSINKVANKFQIPRSTLQKLHLNKGSRKVGRPGVFSEEEEDIFVTYVSTVADWGFPLDLMDIRMLAKAYLDKAGRQVPVFKQNFPGTEWATSFISRNKKKLTTRLCSNISAKRAGVGPEKVNSYFKNLEESLQGIPPENIINFDETNLADDPGRKKCIFRRGVRYPDRVMNSSKGSVSVMFAGSPSGAMLPPYVVYKAEHLWDTWTEGGPPNTRYNRSKSGWFDSTCFTDWFQTTLLPFLRQKEGPKVIIGDNLSSHFSPEVIDQCQQHEIRFVCLPPNSTHLTQPLDVAFFRPMKEKWRHILEEHKRKNRSGGMTKDGFPILLSKVMDEIEPNASNNIKAGFRECGIFPLNKEKVMSKIPQAEGETSQVETRVSESVIELLQTMRYESSTTTQRRKRISVEPGKSISPEDFDKERKDESQESGSSKVQSLNIGDYVIVEYEAELFPGVGFYQLLR